VTSRGHSPLTPKESSGKNRFPTAGDIADDTDAGRPSYDEPAVKADVEVPVRPAREKKAKVPRVPKPPKTRSDIANRRLHIAAAIVGAIGLTFSLVLAFGALFVALDAGQGSGFFAHLSDLCDVLVGPSKKVFDFSGANAEKKQALVAWGVGSMGYLLIGRFAQSILLSRIKD
jgi:hypothetical protein